jgi:hypothetical protein
MTAKRKSSKPRRPKVARPAEEGVSLVVGEELTPEAREILRSNSEQLESLKVSEVPPHAAAGLATGGTDQPAPTQIVAEPAPSEPIPLRAPKKRRGFLATLRWVVFGN